MSYSNVEHSRVDIGASVRYTGDEEVTMVAEHLKMIIEQSCEILGIGHSYHGFDSLVTDKSKVKDVTVNFSLYDVFDSELNILHHITNQKGIGLSTKTN